MELFYGLSFCIGLELRIRAHLDQNRAVRLHYINPGWARFLYRRANKLGKAADVWMQTPDGDTNESTYQFDPIPESEWPPKSKVHW